MRVVFYSFIQIFPKTDYWKVRDAYKYIEGHWEVLCPGKTRRKHLLMLFYFVSFHFISFHFISFHLSYSIIKIILGGVGAWRKQLQDALSHNKQYFISGMHLYGTKGTSTSLSSLLAL